jgi:RimJ/RimL family protein N-acetyltransferase
MPERPPAQTSSEPIDLVPLALRHKAATLQWMNDAQMMPLLNRLNIITSDEHDGWFSSLPGRIDVAYFAVEHAGTRRHIGNIWLHSIERLRSAEVRIVLSPDMHSRRVGQTAISLLSRYAFGEMRLQRLYAYVLATNPRARRAFEKAGFGVEDTLKAERWTGTSFVDAWLLARCAPM